MPRRSLCFSCNAQTTRAAWRASVYWMYARFPIQAQLEDVAARLDDLAELMLRHRGQAPEMVWSCSHFSCTWWITSCTVVLGELMSRVLGRPTLLSEPTFLNLQRIHELASHHDVRFAFHYWMLTASVLSSFGSVYLFMVFKMLS